MFKRFFLLTVLGFLLSSSVVASKSNPYSCQKIWGKIQKNYKLESLYIPLIGLCGEEFREKLRVKIATNIDLGYDRARYIMFAKLDNVNGSVCGVYSNECILTEGIPNHRLYNTEHSWCQSWGAIGFAKSDLHHLYPAQARLNSRRNNFPFCEVVTYSWADYGSFFGKSYTGKSCFEPRDPHKGALSRAMFYFAVRYSKKIDQEQEEFFRKWNREHIVTDKEYQRNENIYFYQNNKNPFILYPELIDLIKDY